MALLAKSRIYASYRSHISALTFDCMPFGSEASTLAVLSVTNNVVPAYPKIFFAIVF